LNNTSIFQNSEIRKKSTNFNASTCELETDMLVQTTNRVTHWIPCNLYGEKSASKKR